MKKVISSHVYDTDSAKAIAVWDNGEGHSPKDFFWFQETLYRTKSGLYFIHGEGGPKSPYAERLSDGWASGELIIPTSASDAQLWAEEHLDRDAYIAAFGEPDEGDVHMLSTSISEASYRRLREYATTHGATMAAVLESLIDDSLTESR